MDYSLSQTTNYSKFKFFPHNRAISPRHVDLLADAIQRDNRLNYQPILCTPNLEVIDGQHRLKACEKLKIPVVYIVTDKDPKMIMVDTNATVSAWRLDDYLHFYVNQGCEEYIKIKECMDKFSVRFSIINCLLAAPGDVKGLRFRSGDVQFDDRIFYFLQASKDFIVFLKKFLDKDRKRLASNRPLYISLFGFFRIDPKKYAKLLSCLQDKVYHIPHFGSATEYDKFFTEIYRKKVLKKKDVE